MESPVAWKWWPECYIPSWGLPGALLARAARFVMDEAGAKTKGRHEVVHATYSVPPLHYPAGSTRDLRDLPAYRLVCPNDRRVDDRRCRLQRIQRFGLAQQNLLDGILYGLASL